METRTPAFLQLVHNAFQRAPPSFQHPCHARCTMLANFVKLAATLAVRIDTRKGKFRRKLFVVLELSVLWLFLTGGTGPCHHGIPKPASRKACLHCQTDRKHVNGTLASNPSSCVSQQLGARNGPIRPVCDEVHLARLPECKGRLSVQEMQEKKN